MGLIRYCKLYELIGRIGYGVLRDVGSLLAHGNDRARVIRWKDTIIFRRAWIGTT